MKKFIAIFSIFVLSLGSGCFSSDEESTGDTSMNYIIPPVSSMTIDYSSFDSISAKYIPGKDTTPGVADLDAAEGLCLLGGGILVAWGTLVAYTPFIIPVAIFTALRNQIPTEVSPDRVVWSYTLMVNSVNHTASVVAEKPGANGYDWDWSVSIDGYVFITGGSMENHSSGWWQFHDPITLPLAADEVVRVEWTYTDATHNSVEFTNNNVNNAVVTGDRITFSRTGDDVSVAFYDIHNGTTTDDPINEVTVYWNISTEAGGINNITNSANSCVWDPND